MRILIASRGVVPIKPGCGGAELLTAHLAKHMALQGHEVTFAADVDSSDFLGVSGLQIVPVQTRLLRIAQRLSGGFGRWIVQHYLGNRAVAKRVKKLLRDQRQPYDVVHTNGNLSTALIARKTSIPVIYTEHDATPWSCRYRRWYERWIRKVVYRSVNGAAFRRATRIVTAFDMHRREIIERWGIPEEKVVCIRNGADLDVFTPRRPGSSPAREDFGFERYCLFVGSLVSRKSPDLLLKAVAEADVLPCVFAGDGPMRRKLERQVVELGISSKVAFLGNVSPPELGGLLASADMLVMPTVSDTAPLAVIEAMACGIPVIASRIAGLPSLVEDWETGFLTKPGDVGQLSMAIRFLAGDERLRTRMGENARARVVNDFPWPVVTREYVSLYASLKGASGPGISSESRRNSEGVLQSA